MTEPINVYRIKVTLRGSQPPIWRRIQVNSNTSLAKFHRILQRVMGWKDAHLHRFVIEGEYYGTPNENERGSRTIRDEREYTLRDVVPREGWQFVYDYDFGDYWQHVLVVEKTLAPQMGVLYPGASQGLAPVLRRMWEGSAATTISWTPSPTLPIPNTKTLRNRSGAHTTLRRLT